MGTESYSREVGTKLFILKAAQDFLDFYSHYLKNKNCALREKLCDLCACLPAGRVKEDSNQSRKLNVPNNSYSLTSINSS